GSNVYVKWRIKPDQTLPSGPLQISYTTDDVVWTLGPTGIDDGPNGGCPTSPAYPGCFVWLNTVSSSYLKLRLEVTNTNGMVTYAQPPPLNVFPPVNFIAGDLEPGLGASAQSALFYAADNYYGGRASYSLVVMPDGVIYYSDPARGILRIDPEDGVQR